VANKKKNANKIGVALNAPPKVAELLVFGQHVHDTMAANSKTLPSPSPALLVLQTDINTLAAKEAVVKTRVAGAVIDRDAALKVLRNDLHNERAYVQLVVNSDPENAASIATAAGMTLVKPPARNKPPLAVKAGATSGVVHVVAKATKGAKANNWQLSTDGGKTWVDLPETTRARTQVANLTPGTTVQFRQRALTKTGASDWSLPVPHVVA
jgi:hypothetical protein